MKKGDDDDCASQGSGKDSDPPDELIRSILDALSVKDREHRRELLINYCIRVGTKYLSVKWSSIRNVSDRDAIVNIVAYRVCSDKSLRTYELNGKFLMRFLRAVRNELTDMHRKTSNIDEVPLDAEIDPDEGGAKLGDNIPDSKPTPEDAFLNKELIETVNHFLDGRMPALERTVFKSRALMGLSNQEVSLMMGIPPEEVVRI